MGNHHSYDIGIDAGFLDNRINLSIDYYYKKTRDLLNTVQLPASTGYVSTLQNVGSIQNKGWEFAADAQVLNGEVTWNVSANISSNRTKS